MYLLLDGMVGLAKERSGQALRVSEATAVAHIGLSL